MKQRHLFWVLGIVLALLLNAASAVRADQALIGFSNYITGGADVRTLGWEFTLSQSVIVTHLGLWDYQANGLLESHKVTIWSTGTVKQRLVEGTVPAGGSPGSQWRWVSVTPTTLGPGTYRIGALYTVQPSDRDNPLTNDLIVGIARTVTTSGPVSYVRNVYGTTTNYPSSTYAPQEKGFFGPNFQYAPEPALLQLPALIGMSGIAYALRRKRRSSAM